MTNYNKSFSFRNGVQVDNSNFVVNPLGLVGIGTSVPTELLDVRGTIKTTGLFKSPNAAPIAPGRPNPISPSPVEVINLCPSLISMAACVHVRLVPISVTIMWSLVSC